MTYGGEDGVEVTVSEPHTQCREVRSKRRTHMFGCGVQRKPVLGRIEERVRNARVSP